VLKKELVFAKNIMKNPNLFQKAFEEMNFDRKEEFVIERRKIEQSNSVFKEKR